MLSHALTIMINEINRHLNDYYTLSIPGMETPQSQIQLGNLAEGLAADKIPRNMLVLSMVNIKEEKTMKNMPHVTSNENTISSLYKNPPIFVNLQILITATHTEYTNALLMLSRVMRFFQFNNVFTNKNVAQDSLKVNEPINPLDQLTDFKFVFDLYSPTMEEINYMWGTLGGKQFPFVIYIMRMLNLQFSSEPIPGDQIKIVTQDIHPRPTDAPPSI